MTDLDAALGSSLKRLLGVGLLLLLPAMARGDGGAVLLSQRVGEFQVTVFTSPTPLRAGPVDVSVLVQDAASGQALPEAQLTLRLKPAGRSDPILVQPVTASQATNKLLRAAKFELPEPGRWQAELEIETPAGPERLPFALEVAEPLPAWYEMGFWIALPAGVVVLFLTHLLLTAGRFKKTR